MVGFVTLQKIPVQQYVVMLGNSSTTIEVAANWHDNEVQLDWGTVVAEMRAKIAVVNIVASIVVTTSGHPRPSAFKSTSTRLGLGPSQCWNSGGTPPPFWIVSPPQIWCAPYPTCPCVH